MTGCVILAAGPGTRLGALGTDVPKTMLRLAGRPYLEHLAEFLLKAGIRPIVVTVHHRAEVVRNHFAAGSRWSDLLFVDTGLRGTGSGVLDSLTRVPSETFLVCNGDTVVDIDVAALLAFTDERPDHGTIVLSRRRGVPNQEAFYVAGDNTVLASLEAAPRQPVPPVFSWRGSSTGVLVLRKSLVQGFDAARPLSLERTVLPEFVAAGRLRAFDNGSRYFLDFGTPERLAELRRNMADPDQRVPWQHP